MSKKAIGGAVVAAGLILGLVTVPLYTERIDAGYAGVVYNMRGGIEDELLTQGFHVVSPMKKVRKYSTAIEQGYLSKDEKEGSLGDESFSVPTRDGKQVSVDLEFAYNFAPETLPETFTKFKGQDGQTIESTFMKGKLKAWTGEVTSRYSVLDIYGEQRADINKAIVEYVKPKFKEYGINIESTNLSRVGLDKQTAKAIQERVNAQQALERERTEKEKATIEVEKKKIQAQGVADSDLIRAEAKAKANEKLQQSITTELVEYKKMEKWDGKMPQVQGGNAIVDLK